MGGSRGRGEAGRRRHDAWPLGRRPHLAACPHCTEYLAQMRATIELAGRITPEDLTPQMQDEFIALYRQWQADGSDQDQLASRPGPQAGLVDTGTVTGKRPEDHAGELVSLRAFREDDLPFLDRLCTDPDALGYFEWTGFADVRSRRKRWEKDGYVGEESTGLAIVLPDGEVIGIASFAPRDRGGLPGICYEIGLALLPEHRGRGLGTATQRLLVEYLFSYTTAHRLEAGTSTRNIAEQKSLERVGFRREGVLRGIGFQHGEWQDAVIYSLLRDEAPGQQSGAGAAG